MSTTEQHFILVLVNVKTKTSLGVEFCRNMDDLEFKRSMFLRDFGPDYVALTYPSSISLMADAWHVAEGGEAIHN